MGKQQYRSCKLWCHTECDGFDAFEQLRNFASVLHISNTL